MSTTNDLARFAILDKFISDNKPVKDPSYFSISFHDLHLSSFKTPILDEKTKYVHILY